jgi:hypothetical protein
VTAEPKDKTVRFIAKLIELSQNGTIVWSPTGRGPSNYAIFETYVDDKKLRISKDEVQPPPPPPPTTTSGGLLSNLSLLSLGTSFSGSRMTLYSLDVIDNQGRVVYSFGLRAGLSDLYESAAFSASGVNDLMNSVLSKK